MLYALDNFNAPIDIILNGKLDIAPDCYPIKPTTNDNVLVDFITNQNRSHL